MIFKSVTRMASSRMNSHIKCRYPEPFVYVGSDGHKHELTRAKVDEANVAWSTEMTDYEPIEFTHPKVLAKPVWADPVDPKEIECWNEVDEKRGVDRRSFSGKYVVKDGFPLNIVGRTGLRGRGLLGKWGPNHAADPVVTRWKLDSDGSKDVHEITNKNVLQFVAIQRRDNQAWALPGGMVDAGETVSKTLIREFVEEAMASFEDTKDALRVKQFEKTLGDFFSNGIELYSGYVDDPRNTDNAWMETVAMQFHDDTGEVVANLPFKAGDDAKDLKWMDVDKQMVLYASHAQFLKVAAERMNAHW